MKNLLLLVLALLLFACGGTPVGNNASPLEASLVVMGQRITDQSDPDVPATIEQYPECMAVAVGPDRVLTSDHCPIALDNAYVLVTYDMWVHTARGNVLADAVRVRGEVRELRPRAPLDAWIGTAAAGDGPATRVVLRDTDIVELPTRLSGDMFTGEVFGGDSGGPLFQGRAVGLTQTCNGTADKQCDLDGGRFSAP